MTNNVIFSSMIANSIIKAQCRSGRKEGDGGLEEGVAPFLMLPLLLGIGSGMDEDPREDAG
jgi:hypothetical protein